MKKFLALLLALVMTMSLVTVGASAKTAFTDDKDITEVEAVEVLSAMGIIDGYKDGSFKPKAELNRAAGAKFIAYLMLGEKKADGLVATGTLFEDVAADYALAPYVEYCAKMGYVDGYGNGKFGPKNALTQAAFGKMLLTALGYDSATEGYTGAGWQKTVYADGVAAGVYGDDGEIFAACNRETAAKMALGALTADLVEYGKTVVKGVNKVFVTENGAVATGEKLFEKYDKLKYYEGCDIYGRLGHVWEYKSFEQFYMDAPVAEYTEKVSACDILVDLGIAKTNLKKDIDVVAVIEDGEEVDGYKAAYDHKDCDDKFGGQGALTQVFETENDDGDTVYVITVINTYLAEVTNVKEVKHDKQRVATATLQVYGADADAVTIETDTLEEDDMVLVNLGEKLEYNVDDETLIECVWTGDAFESETTAFAWGYVDILGAADSKDGKLTGFSKTDATTSLDKTPYDNAAKFVYGYTDLAALINKNDTKVTAYFDQYGNMIGVVEYDEDDVYAVVDAAWRENVKGTNTAFADLVGFDAKAIVEAGELDNNDIGLFKVNNDGMYDDIYTYTVNSDDEYVLDKKVEGKAFKSYKDAVLTFTDSTTAKIDNDTVILVKDANGDYTTYTGYKAMKDLVIAAKAAVVYETKNGVATDVADYVFITGAYFKGDTVSGWIYTYNNDWEGDFYWVKVWNGTTETKVLVNEEDTFVQNMNDDFFNELWYVDFTIAIDKNGNLVADDVKPNEEVKYCSGLTFKTLAIDVEHYREFEGGGADWWFTYEEDVPVYLLKTNKVVEYSMEKAEDALEENEIFDACAIVYDGDDVVAVYFCDYVFPDASVDDSFNANVTDVNGNTYWTDVKFVTYDFENRVLTMTVERKVSGNPVPHYVHYTVNDTAMVSTSIGNVDNLGTYNAVLSGVNPHSVVKVIDINDSNS